MENKKNIAVVILSILVLGLGFYSYIESKNNKSLKQEKIDLSDVNSQQDEKIREQENVIDKLSIKAEYNEQRIAQLESMILGKEMEVTEGKERSKLLEQEKKELVNELSVIASSGASPKTKEHIARLTSELEIERTRLVELNDERNKLAEQYNLLQRNKIDMEEEIAILNSNLTVTLRENQSLKSRLEIADISMVLMNVRGDVKDLSANPRANRFDFSVAFSEEDLAKLKSSNLREISIVPTIIDRRSGLTYVPQQRGELNSLYSKSIMEIQQVEKFVYIIENPSLPRKYNNKNAVNYERGDEMLLTIKIPELNDLEIVRHEFKMK